MAKSLSQILAAPKPATQQPSKKKLVEEIEDDLTTDPLPDTSVSQLDEISDMADEIGDVLEAGTTEEVPSWVSENVSEAHSLLQEIIDSIDYSEDEEGAVVSEATEAAPEIDEKKFTVLARMGLVDSGEIPKVLRALKASKEGKNAATPDLKAIAAAFEVLVGLITADDALFSKVKQSLP